MSDVKALARDAGRRVGLAGAEAVHEGRRRDVAGRARRSASTASARHRRPRHHRRRAVGLVRHRDGDGRRRPADDPRRRRHPDRRPAARGRDRPRGRPEPRRAPTRAARCSRSSTTSRRGAKECFATADGGELNFANNIRALADKSGPCERQRRSSTTSATSTSRSSATASISDAVDDVAAQGVHYFSSAGNGSAQQAYQAPLRIIAPDSAGRHVEHQPGRRRPDALRGRLPGLRPGAGRRRRAGPGARRSTATTAARHPRPPVGRPDRPQRAAARRPAGRRRRVRSPRPPPIASIPFDGTAGETIRGHRRRDPVGHDRPHPLAEGPRRRTSCSRSTRARARRRRPDAAGRRHVHVRGLRLRRRPGDFTFEVAEVLGTSRTTTDLNALFFDADGQLPRRRRGPQPDPGRPFEIAGFHGRRAAAARRSPRPSTDAGNATQLRYQCSTATCRQRVRPAARAERSSAIRLRAGRDRRRGVRPVPAVPARGLHVRRRRPADPVRLERQPPAAARHPPQAGGGGDRRREHDVLRLRLAARPRRPAELLRHQRRGAARRRRSPRSCCRRAAGRGRCRPAAMRALLQAQRVHATTSTATTRGVERRSDDHRRRRAGRERARRAPRDETGLDERPAVLHRAATRARARSCR